MSKPVNYKVRAEYEYQGKDESQLTFSEGTIITVLEEDESGWWTGRLSDGTEGYFPETFVKKIESGPGAPRRAPPPPSGAYSSGIPTNAAITQIQAQRAMSGSVYNQAAEGDAASENYYSMAALDLKTNPNAKSRFGVAAYYMALAASICSFFLGMSGFIWAGKTAPNLKTNKTIAGACGAYCFLHGIIGWFAVSYYGIQRKKDGFPVRAVVYFLSCLAPFASLVTALAGGMWLVAATFDFLAYYKKESYEMDKKKQQKESMSEKCTRYLTYDFYRARYNEIRQQSKMKKYMFLFVFVLFNIVFTLERAERYQRKVDNVNRKAKIGYNVLEDEDDDTELTEKQEIWGELAQDNGYEYALGAWFPMAKMMGSLLDVNCAFIVLPVCRTFIRYLYNISTDQRSTSRALSFLLSFMPLDKAIQWHKAMAALTVFGTIFHGWAHFNHYAEVPGTYDAVFGPGVWITGVLCIIIMQLLFSTSFEAVRHGKFELFWYTHHLFILFFISILFHGAGNINPNFWKWFVAPGLLYLVERLLREYKSSQPVGVVSVTHMNNKSAKVYCLELEKTGPIKNHQEGQYVFLNAPAITKFQWHPFTISSPPDQKTLTVHIRNMGEGTWTGRLQEYFQAMSPKKAYYECFHREADHLVPQTTGPDGQYLIRIDGPMGCPTQHLGEYTTCVIVGAGIGVTPVRASLQSIIYYRFSRGIGQSFPDNAYCVWIVRHAQLPAYRFMCRTLKEAEDHLYDLRAKNKETMRSKVFQMHVFVTRAPDNPQFNPSEIDSHGDEDLDLAIWGPHYNQVYATQHGVERVKAPFTEEDIYRTMYCPKPEPVQLGDIIVHSSRPDWNAFFGPLREHHSGQNIGVMFCGPAIVASQLKQACGNYTDFASKTVFKLHKENF